MTLPTTSKHDDNNDDNNGNLDPEQLLYRNGTECYKPDRGTTSTEIHPRLLWCEMLRYGRRAERHDTLRTLLQQLRISDIFNADHGVQRHVPHEVHKTRKRTLVQRRTKRMERRRRRRRRVSRPHIDAAKYSLVVAVAIKPLFLHAEVPHSHKIEMFFLERIEYSEPDMNRQQQEQQFFKETAKLLADDKITPEQACSFIVTLRDSGIIADDILDPEPEQEQQKGFNEIAGVFADWKITTEEACELFTEWIGEHAVTKDSCSPYNFKLTPEERAIQSGKHKFGLCSSCDVGLDDRADFHVYFNDEKMEVTCNACDHHFTGGGAC